MNLNKDQLKAADHFNGPMLVTAGPGSGKTAVITKRILNLIENRNVKPGYILTVTFTRAAAGQMSERFRTLSNNSSYNPVFGTFHSIFYKILKTSLPSGHRIISEKEKAYLIRCELEKYSDDLSEDEDTAARIINNISLLKSQSKTADKSLYPDIYIAYHKALKAGRLIDLDDIVINTYELLIRDSQVLKFWQEYFQYIQIDEFQDINDLQYRIMLLLAGKRQNIFVVGDADQSIYGFRGSSPFIMEQFVKDTYNCTRIYLTENYRSPQQIILPAQKLISANHSLRKPQIISRRSDPDAGFDIVCFKDQDQQYTRIAQHIKEYHKNGVSYSDIAVLIRSGLNIRDLQSIFTKENIPFTGFKGKDRYNGNHFLITDILCYLKAASGTASRKDILRIINRPSRFISANAVPDPKTTDIWEHMRRYYYSNPAALARIDLLKSQLLFLTELSSKSAIDYILKAVGYNNYLIQYKSENPEDKTDFDNIIMNLKTKANAQPSLKSFVSLMDNFQLHAEGNDVPDDNEKVNILTMHACKGLEFKVVFIPDVNEKMIPSSHAMDEESIREERRLLYVAMTRASFRLHLSYCTAIHEKRLNRSMFIDEILVQ